MEKLLQDLSKRITHHRKREEEGNNNSNPIKAAENRGAADAIERILKELKALNKEEKPKSIKKDISDVVSRTSDKAI
jgi:hypothetical protein